MEFTGERFLPEVGGCIALEHEHRYLLAALYARDKDILDIASGEGYGSALLAGTARSVVGVDISFEAVAHAQHTYTARNLRYVQGDASAIPLPDASVDMVVSFETIEHHDRHEEMLREIKRVLRPGGLLCMSSPDRVEYSEVPGYHNEYHVKELDRQEFETLLDRHFAHRTLTGQRIVYGSLVGAETACELLSWKSGQNLHTPAVGLPRAEYLIALASDAALPESFSSLMEGGVADSYQYKAAAEEKEALRQHAHALQQQAQQHADTLQHQINDLEQRYESLQRNADVQSKTLQETIDELRQRTVDQHEAVRSLESRLHERSNRAALVEGELQAMLSSRSWRVTKPLRGVVGLMRKLRSRAPADGGQLPEAQIPCVATTPRNNPVQARVAAYKAGLEYPAAEREAVRNVRIYAADAGNNFFLEIAELIRCGFADIGITATIVVPQRLEDCADPANAEADLHLIVAPHELFHFIPEAMEWPHRSGRIWLLNTEQEHTTWFARAQAAFGIADLVLDMDLELAERLNAHDVRADHLPLGFSPSCTLFDGQDPIACNAATEGLPLRIRDWDAGDTPLARALSERPLDCCFFGASTARRTAFFARHAALFSDVESYLRLKPVTGPLRVGTTTPLSTECVSSIVRRSKIALNIHQSEHSYFEWHRIILQGVHQGAAVLSEPCTAAWPFKPNSEYIASDMDHLADTLEYLLRSDDGRAMAERVRQNAYTTLTTACRMGDRLRELLRLYAGMRGGRR